MNRFMLLVQAIAFITTIGNQARGHTFSSTQALTLTHNRESLPYPGTLAVSGLSGTITEVTVTLTGVTHPRFRDLDILLVAPSGVSILIVSDVGGLNPVSDVTLTFQDGAPPVHPSIAPVSGTYSPHDRTDGDGPDVFPPPAPPGPYGAAPALSDFIGTDPNGVWMLCIYDDSAEIDPVQGSLAGWSLTFVDEPFGTCFTYQGRLSDDGIPIDGPVDLRFVLLDSSGGQLGGPVTLSNVDVVDGLFSVELNENGEFGADAFGGEARFLEVAVASPPGGAFVPLAPWQAIKGAPYAHHAISAQTAATSDSAASVPWSGLTGVPADFADGIDDVGASQWTTAGSDIHYSAGKVGIGTPTPESQVGIHTSAPAEHFRLSGRSFAHTSTSDQGVSFLLGVNSHVNNRQLWIGASDGLTPSSSNSVFRIVPNVAGSCIIDSLATDGATFAPLHIRGSVVNLQVGGGNVGIGTPTPSAGLHIHKGSSNDVSLQLTSSGPGWGSGVRFENTAAGGRTFGIYSGSDGKCHLVDQTSMASRLAVDSSGNVGIGTTTPGQKLSVAGTIESTNGGIRFPDGSLQITAADVDGWESSLRVIRGVFTDSGAVTAGTGFSVQRVGTGNYVVSFEPGAFSGLPAVVATAVVWPSNPAYVVINPGSPPGSGLIVSVMRRADGQSVDAPVNFIAIGPR